MPGVLGHAGLGKGAVDVRYAPRGDIQGLTGTIICRKEGQHRTRPKKSLQSYFIPGPKAICSADRKFCRLPLCIHSIFWECLRTSFPHGVSLLHVCLYIPLCQPTVPPKFPEILEFLLSVYILKCSGVYPQGSCMNGK